MTSKTLKKKRCILIAVVTFYILTLSPSLADRSTKEGFLQDIRTAIENKNKEEFLTLFNWEGTGDAQKTYWIMLIDKTHLFEYTLKNIEFTPLPKNFSQTIIQDGIILKFNSSCEGLVKISHREKVGLKGFAIPYGFKDGKYCFTLYAPVMSESDTNNWACGNWITIKLSSTIVDKNKQQDKSILKKHILIFEKNGEMKKYLNNKNIVKLPMKYRTKGDLLEISATNQNNFDPFGVRVSDDKLKLFSSEGSYIIYQRIDAEFTDDDLKGSLVIEDFSTDREKIN